jgi:oligosaccharide repeat unit polymerase
MTLVVLEKGGTNILKESHTYKIEKRPISFLMNYIVTSIGLIFNMISLIILYSQNHITLSHSFILSYSFTVYVIIYLLTIKKISYKSTGMFVIYYMLIQTVGIPFAYLFDIDIADKFLMRDKLLYGKYLDKYVAISIISITSIFVGISFANSKTIKMNTENKKKIEEEKNYYYIIGSILISLFSIFMLYNLVAGNISLSNHDSYTKWALGSRGRNYLQFGYWFGSIFVIASCKKKQLIIPLLIFSLPSIILIITGNRNDVLFPLIIGLGIYIYRFKSVPKLLILLLLFFILFISPIIAATRATGIDISSNNSSFLELAASSFSELGSQLTPVSYMFTWLSMGESYAFGGTYFFGSLAELFGVINPVFREDYSNSRFDLTTRLPDLGFSMSGEVFYNFGTIGLIFIYLLIGIYIAKKESNLMDTDRLVRYSFTCFTLLFLVRNAFSSYISIIVIFYLLYFLEKLIRNEIKKKSKFTRNNN